MNNKPTQNPGKHLFAKLIASAALTVFAIAMPMAANAASLSMSVNADAGSTGGNGLVMMSVSWGGCSACGK